MFNNADVNANAQNDPVYQLDGGKSVWVHEGCFDILDESGNALFDPPLRISEFSRHPRSYINMIAEKLK